MGRARVCTLTCDVADQSLAANGRFGPFASFRIVEKQRSFSPPDHREVDHRPILRRGIFLHVAAGMIPLGAGQMAIDIGRRQVISALGGAVFGWPLAARAQQPPMPVIGFLSIGSPETTAPLVTAFRRGLGEAGYVEGRNVAIEYRWAEGQYDRLPALASDLAHRSVSVIAAAGGGAAALAAKAATTTIPIVFQVAVDPVKLGLVASLNRPGGNITGVSNLAAELGPKRLELMHELLPNVNTIALLVNPTNPATAAEASRMLQAAADSLGLKLQILHASAEHDFDSVFESLAQSRAGGLLIVPDLFFVGRIEQIAALTVRHAVPAIFQLREFAAAGGLMSYGGNLTDAYHQLGLYSGRILKGEKPADMPIQQFTKVELIINLKTAKTLGITFPITLLGRADEVIE